MSKSNIVVSIIIPVYNVEDYLSECLESVISQLYTKWECILVDDGSTDNSGSICDEYARRDSRIRYIHKKNEGVSVARNMAIEMASGQWIAFVDSDDFISENYLQKMVEQISDEKQLIISGYDIIGNQRRYEYESKIIKGCDIVPFFINNHIIDKTMPWAKLYNRQVIEDYHIRFPEGVQMGEDAIFLLEYMYYVEVLTIVDEIGYHNRLHSGSLITRINSFESEWKTFILWKDRLERLVMKKSIVRNEKNVIWNNGIGKHFTRCLRCIYIKCNNYGYSEQISILKSIPAEYYNEYIKHYKGSSLKEKINMLILSFRFFNIFFFFNSIYKNKY